ncbi:chemotaxis protein CheA [Tritonibacter scottomollicae]|uniref:Chemotaxis protein CheA n=1 Tax=Tritonibacter scottomollicae TaxID=483013 RepID=A0ABZ0HJ16_TRISK|nr:chemotaxis protein CheA [Tritonibacter scottomollicae]WOI34828.1 chemotaxis protein CheA [Tritonibacter scottomollicae]
MVHNNKVLTVSYGTFSCTLEGFEDSFGTMKVIAEYFRDLASDDRYFGAEPPQPDADMLARIAQKEIARQVEARSGEGGIHLRAAAAAEQPPAPAQPALTSAPSTAAEVAPSVSEAPQTDSQPEDATPTQSSAAAEDAESTDEETATARSEDDTSEADTDNDASDAILWSVNTTLTPAEPVAAADPDAEDITPASPATAPPREDTVPAQDSIAAKLQRIRAVVAKTPADNDDFTEDEHAETVVTEETSELEDVLTTGDDADSEAVSASEEESVSDILDRLDLTGSRAASRDADEDPADEIEEQAVAQEIEDEAEIQPEHAPVAATPPTAASPVGAEPADAGAASAGPAGDPPREKVTPRRPKQGRVIRVKRAQVDPNLIDATAEPLAEPQPSEPSKTPALAAASSLSEDDEADLAAELAAVEAELLASSTDRADDDAAKDETSEEEDAPYVTPQASQHFADSGSAADEAASARPARDILTSRDSASDGDVSRLMAAADHRLNDEDATTSRETYNQLRAAVAAAQADSDGSDEARREARTRAFRDDLASVVRPGRPASDAMGDTAAEPMRAKAPSAPLKLVAEQRIDPSEKHTPSEVASAVAEGARQAATAPVRPRRVSSALLTPEPDEATSATQQDGAFADYASDKGAVELSELLEAAASYMSFVEGRESFSRPQLINKVRTLDTAKDGFNREDGLRSFGLLLREGKLKKASNGRFSVSSQIGFRPDNRAAG